MILTVKPASVLKGTVELPASKSYSIRAFMIAACGGNSIIINPSNCEDAKVAMHTASVLGSRITRTGSTQTPKFKIKAYQIPPKLSKINVKESGTVLRFLLPLLALHGERSTVHGEGTLRGRPNLYLTRTLRKMGVNVKGSGSGESIPIQLYRGKLRGGTFPIEASLSSQFISALLITCPRLFNDTRLILKGKRLVSTDYITMTRQTLRKSGIKIKQNGSRQYQIKGRQKFQGLKNFTIPSDFGLAAFLMAAAVLVPSNVKLNGQFRKDLIQADGQILPLLKKMGVRLKKSSSAIHIKGPCHLKGGAFSLKNCPDLVPIMAVLALFAKGKTRLYNIGHVRSKESDRISDLKKELIKVGAKIKEKRDELIIEPQIAYKRNCMLNPHHDHRLAMAFCVLGAKLGVRVKDIECTHKSYPNFVKDIKSIGVTARRA